MRFLLDEMLPAATAAALEAMGHTPVGVRAVGLGNTPDDMVLAAAIDGGWVLVTENAHDLAPLVAERMSDGSPACAVVIVHRGRFPGGAIVDRLARALDAWATANPDPWDGPHWLTLDGD